MKSRSSTSLVRLPLVISALSALPLCAIAQEEAFPLSETAAGAEPVLHLAQYEVTGTRQNALDSTALKMDTKVIETPRSLTIIDSTRIREQDFQSASELLFWVPGINSNGDSYHFYARGFRMVPSDWKVDGFQGRVIGGSYAPNLFGVENVSVLKGPAGILYGATSSPGGQISLTTKKPREVASTTVETRYNTFGGSGSAFGEAEGVQVSVDSTGPVTKGGRLLYRFLSKVEDAATDPSADDRNSFHRLSFTAKLDEVGKYQLTPMVEWSRENRETRGPFISPSSSRTTADNSTAYTLSDMSRRDLNLAAGGRVDENLTFGTDFTGKISDAWTTNASLRYHERDYSLNSFAVQTGTLKQEIAGDPLSWTVKRRHSRARSETNTLSFDANTAYEARFGDKVRNSTMVGLNARRADAFTYTGTSGADQSAINIYTGAESSPLVEDASTTVKFASATRTFAWNGYLQNRTTIADQWIVNLSTGLTGDTVTTSTTRTKRNSDVKPNASLTWLITPKYAVYTSYSTSYNLPTATYEDVNGNTGGFDPIEGESFEVGTKAEFIKDLVAASLAVFDTQLNNTLVQSATNELNPNGIQYYRQLDSGRRSKGVELEFTVSPVKAWETTATYAYVDAYDRANGVRTYRADLTPRHALSLYSRYAFLVKEHSSWAVRGGLIWQSERNSASLAASTATTSKVTDPFVLDSFHRFDVGISRRYKGWDFALSVENVTNELYLVTGSTGLNMNPVRPRAYSFRVAHTW